VDALMQRAGQGAADYVWRIAGPQRRVTVLTGPGNNGGDGWVIAETLRRWARAWWCPPPIRAPRPPATPAPPIWVMAGADCAGDVLVDCLFGTGLSRGLDEGDLALLTALAARHAKRIAIDLPSGIATDTGRR
jgi:NAD(P)H-hydrate repair Nnr-like enzyme with NAD(P)H-hydrate epimerase domain